MRYKIFILDGWINRVFYWLRKNKIILLKYSQIQTWIFMHMYVECFVSKDHNWVLKSVYSIKTRLIYCFIKYD